MTKTIDESYSVELDYPALTPGFEIIPLLLVLFVGIVARKRKRK
ncbi:MAG: Heimdall-CTERM domain-containing surface protein [Candidatus Hodarchaeales archaeon]